MLKQVKADHLALPEQIAAFVEGVCEKQGIHGTAIRPPHMLVPLDSGNGRSHMGRIIASRYYDTKACSFSSRDIFLDFTVSGTVQSINETSIEIQTSAEYSNHFSGVIALDIDAVLPHLSDASGARFFELVSKIKEHATLILFVPADCSRKNIDLIAGKVGISMTSFPPISFSDEELTRFFCGFLPAAIVPPGLQAPMRLSAAIDDGYTELEERIGIYISQNVRSKTIKNIKEAAEALFYSDEAKEMLLSNFGRKKDAGAARRTLPQVV
jgi:hypothetical protein